jgi:hypothetical protein
MSLLDEYNLFEILEQDGTLFNIIAAMPVGPAFLKIQNKYKSKRMVPIATFPNRREAYVALNRRNKILSAEELERITANRLLLSRMPSAKRPNQGLRDRRKKDKSNEPPQPKVRRALARFVTPSEPDVNRHSDIVAMFVNGESDAQTTY